MYLSSFCHTTGTDPRKCHNCLSLKGRVIWSGFCRAMGCSRGYWGLPLGVVTCLRSGPCLVGCGLGLYWPLRCSDFISDYYMFPILKQKIVVFGQFSPKFSTDFPVFYTKLGRKIPVESRSKIAVRSPDRDFQKSLSGHRDPGPTGIPVGYWGCHTCGSVWDSVEAQIGSIRSITSLYNIKS